MKRSCLHESLYDLGTRPNMSKQWGRGPANCEWWVAWYATRNIIHLTQWKKESIYGPFGTIASDP